MTMQLIETKTLGTAAASIEFTSIPQDGTDLYVACSLRTNRVNVDQLFVLEFNAVGSGYTSRRLDADGSSVASNTASFIYVMGGGNNSTANTFGNSSIYIPNYAGSTNKSVSVDGVNENNATAASSFIVAGLWSNTAAITSLKLTPNGGESILTGSTISLYKITKGSSGGVVVS